MREIPSGPEGEVDLEALKRELGPHVAALMLTNPNTLGLFERRILEISRLCKEAGVQLYYDGANLNAIMGWARPGDMGFDVVHLNLHKTFTVPHGGGGPGSGPVGVKAHLAPYLPVPLVERGEEGFYLDFDRPKSIGRVRSFYGNFLALVRAWAYIRTLGLEGLKKAAALAVLNARYLKELLKEKGYRVPYDGPSMHEFVAQPPEGFRALDLAKGLLELGFHPHGLLPLDRQGGPHGGAHGDRGQGDPRGLRRGHGGAFKEAQGVAGKRPLLHPGPPPGRASGQQASQAHLL